MPRLPATRVCTKCGKTRSINEYYWKNMGKGIKHTVCKYCDLSRHRELNLLRKGVREAVQPVLPTRQLSPAVKQLPGYVGAGSPEARKVLADAIQRVSGLLLGEAVEVERIASRVAVGDYESIMAALLVTTRLHGIVQAVRLDELFAAAVVDYRGARDKLPDSWYEPGPGGEMPINSTGTGVEYGQAYENGGLG